MRNLIIFLVFLVGCSGGSVPPESPAPISLNLYQPVSECPAEIEYRWISASGEQRSFFSGEGGFCALLSEKVTGSPVEARCVLRDSGGTVLQSGRWVAARQTNLEEFRDLCP